MEDHEPANRKGVEHTSGKLAAAGLIDPIRKPVQNAERDLRRYHRRGADATTRLLLTELRRWPLQGEHTGYRWRNWSRRDGTGG